MPTVQSVSVVDEVTFTCIDAFAEIPDFLRPGNPSLRAALGRELADDDEGDQTVTFTADDLGEQERGALCAAFNPNPDPVPHASWNLTEDQTYCLYMDHWHWYGDRNWSAAFQSIYGRDRSEITRKDYDKRADRWAIRQRDRSRDAFYAKGERPFDIGYRERQRIPDSVWNGIEAGIDARLKRGEQAAKIAEEVTKEVVEKFGNKDEKKDAKKIVLPPIRSLDDMIADPACVPKPDQWEGIIRQNDTLHICGASKSNKTWFAYNFGMAVTNGTPFLGRKTTQAKVLCVDFEMRPASTKGRCVRIADAMRVGTKDMSFLNMRGHAAPIEVLKPSLIEAILKGGFGMVIIDPFYKCGGRRNINDQGDMNDFCNEIEQISHATGATMAVLYHFGKGSAAGKDAKDRSMGSNVISQHPDAEIVLTPHEEDGALTVSSIIRDHPPVEEFCVRFQNPVFELAPDLDPKDLRTAIANGKGKPADADVAEAVGKRELNQTGIVNIMVNDLGFAYGASREAVKKAIRNGVLEECGRNRQAGAANVFYRLSQKGKNI